MAKLNKMYYYTKNGKKLNCYYITFTKIMVEDLDLQDKELEIKVKDGKIIIDKSKEK